MRGLFGQAVGVLLVGLLAMSIIGVAATETFVNKTGHDVYGITVTFSTRVKITRHGYVFPDQDPSSGRSDQFTFSGGKLHNYQRFTIGWIPGTAQVVSYEWLEEEPTAPSEVEEAAPPQETSSSSAPSLPDPNTPPLLYGDDYPGPDEPLYQPKPDEEIWLTDLEGHEDIYDNDGIRINYAPGFDKSKVTKINVYRNGVYMRFLPEKFDVLTNAQMKTFDGNPLEHSPASSHTDHAIMGYEYEFDIYTADHLWILKKTVKSGFRWRPKEVWAFLDISWHWSELDGIPYDSIVKFFEYLKYDGFTGISIVIPYYVMTPYSNDIFEQYTVDHSITNWEIVTPTPSELEKILKAADEAGLDKQVMGFFYVSQSYIDAHKDRYIGKGMMDPKNPKLFFENYTRLLKKIIPLLNKYHVKSLVVLDETGNLNTSYSEFIQEMLTKLSTKFNGRLGIDVAANLILVGIYWDDKKRTWQGTMGQMTFLGWISPDGQRLEDLYSCWAPPLETQEDQRVSVMVPNFVKFWKPLFDYVAAKYSNPPQAFGEIGVFDADGVGLGYPSYEATANKVEDEQEMADVWYAYLKGSKELGVEQIDVWGFSLLDRLPRAVGRQRMWIGYSKAITPSYRIIKAIIDPDTSTGE